MTATHDGLSPADFAASAARAVAACAGLDPTIQARRLADAGLLGVLAPATIGGLGLPLAFAVPVMAAAEAGLLAFPLLESLVIARHAASAAATAQAVVEGSRVGTVAWQGEVRATRRGGTIELNGTVGAAPGAADADVLLLRVDRECAALVERRAAGVTVEEPSGIGLDPVERVVRLDRVTVAAPALLSAGSWRAMEADACLLRAAAIMGGAERCLSLATEHAVQRRQFGHALCHNQAIRHALARHKLGLEGIRHVLERCVTRGDNAGEIERQAVFLAATAAGVAIAEGSLQVFGAMGFTWDMPLHRHVRRLRSLQAQAPGLGMAALGRRVVAEVAAAAV